MYHRNLGGGQCSIRLLASTQSPSLSDSSVSELPLLPERTHANINPSFRPICGWWCVLSKVMFHSLIAVCCCLLLLLLFVCCRSEYNNCCCYCCYRTPHLSSAQQSRTPLFLTQQQVPCAPSLYLFKKTHFFTIIRIVLRTTITHSSI